MSCLLKYFLFQVLIGGMYVIGYYKNPMLEKA